MSDHTKPAAADEPESADERPVTAKGESSRHEELTVVPARDVVVYDPLAAYRREVARFATLTAEEERDLAIRFQEHGDRDAAYRLVTSHLRLVVRIAFDFKRSWQNLLDLIQEGNVGLLLAVQKFDPYRGIRLSTYASWWIRAYVIKFVLDNWRLVKVGTTNARRKLLFNLRKEKDALIAQGIEPGTKLLADRLNVSEEDVIDVERSLGQPDVSIETPMSAGSDRLLRDTLAAGDEPIDEAVANAQQRTIINNKLEAFAATLPERERIVFRERLLAEERVAAPGAQGSREAGAPEEVGEEEVAEEAESAAQDAVRQEGGLRRCRRTDAQRPAEARHRRLIRRSDTDTNRSLARSHAHRRAPWITPSTTETISCTAPGSHGRPSGAASVRSAGESWAGPSGCEW